MNHQIYKASHSAPTKKLAKATAAAACLVALGGVSPSGSAELGAPAPPSLPSPLMQHFSNDISQQQNQQQQPQQYQQQHQQQQQQQQYQHQQQQHLQQHLQQYQQQHAPQEQVEFFPPTFDPSCPSTTMNVDLDTDAGSQPPRHVLIGPQVPAQYSGYNNFCYDNAPSPNVFLSPGTPHESFPSSGTPLEAFPPPESALLTIAAPLPPPGDEPPAKKVKLQKQ